MTVMSFVSYAQFFDNISLADEHGFQVLQLIFMGIVSLAVAFSVGSYSLIACSTSQKHRDKLNPNETSKQQKENEKTSENLSESTVNLTRAKTLESIAQQLSIQNCDNFDPLLSIAVVNPVASTGNLDDMEEDRKVEWEKELESIPSKHEMEEPGPVPQGQHVRFRKAKCKLFETNDVLTKTFGSTVESNHTVLYSEKDSGETGKPEESKPPGEASKGSSAADGDKAGGSAGPVKKTTPQPVGKMTVSERIRQGISEPAGHMNPMMVGRSVRLCPTPIATPTPRPNAAAADVPAAKDAPRAEKGKPTVVPESGAPATKPAAPTSVGSIRSQEASGAGIRPPSKATTTSQVAAVPMVQSPTKLKSTVPPVSKPAGAQTAPTPVTADIRPAAKPAASQRTAAPKVPKVVPTPSKGKSAVTPAAARKPVDTQSVAKTLAEESLSTSSASSEGGHSGPKTGASAPENNKGSEPRPAAPAADIDKAIAAPDCPPSTKPVDIGSCERSMARRAAEPKSVVSCT